MSPDLSPSGTVAAESTTEWKDKKRYLWMIGLVVPSLVFVAIGLYFLTEWSVFLWTGPIMIFVIVPIFDLIFGRDDSNPPEEVIEELSNDRYYRWITFLFIPLQLAAFVWSMYLIATQDWPIVAKVGLAISTGMVGGIAINTAHELGHKREKHERWLSKVALSQTAYGHFYIEHNRGHHVRVSTPEDPASSRMGQSFYRFWPRTVWGSLTSAWNLEANRYRRKDQHPFRPGNDVLNAWAMTVVLWGALLIWLGIGILPYLLIQAVIGFSLLEIVNYLEHYGLKRRKVGKAGRERYERVLPEHSWNANNIPTNVLLYHLQRHSDHHANPTRRYQTLRDYAESPVLPTGYAGMILVALIPPWWSRVMDPKVVAHYGGDIRLANVEPSKFDKLVRKYPLPADEVIDQTATATDTSRQDHGDDVAAARCPGCAYVYEVAVGNEAEGFPAGTPWSQIPDDWTCPDCGVREKVDFLALKESPL